MSNKIKIIFFGYDYFGGQFLQVLLEQCHDKIEVMAVATHPRHSKGSINKKYTQSKNRWGKGLFFKEVKEKVIIGKLINEKLYNNPKPSYIDITVKQLAEKNGIPILDSDKILIGDNQEIINCAADFIIIASFSKIPEAIYSKMLERVINFHPSYLPQLRGGSPVYTAIMRGVRKTGFSFHQLSQVYDAGPLRYQQPFFIDASDNCRQAESKIAQAGAHALYLVLAGIQNQTIGIIDIAGREITKCIRNYEINALLEPAVSTTEDLLRKIRATSSWVLGAAFVRKGFRNIYITEAKAAQWDKNVDGQSIVYKEPEGLLVKSKDGAILVTQAYYKQKYYSGRELAQFKRLLFDIVKR